MDGRFTGFRVGAFFLEFYFLVCLVAWGGCAVWAWREYPSSWLRWMVGLAAVAQIPFYWLALLSVGLANGGQLA